MHVRMYVCMYVCMYVHVCMYVCMYVYVCMYACMHVCMYDSRIWGIWEMLICKIDKPNLLITAPSRCLLSHIHDFSHDYADLANRPSYTFRVRYYANFVVFLF